MPKRKAASVRGSKTSFRCTLCERRIRIPDGWTRGPAVRRHYWAKHRDHMLSEGRGS